MKFDKPVAECRLLNYAGLETATEAMNMALQRKAVESGNLTKITLQWMVMFANCDPITADNSATVPLCSVVPAAAAAAAASAIVLTYIITSVTPGHHGNQMTKLLRRSCYTAAADGHISSTMN